MVPKEKIKTLKELGNISQRIKSEGKKIVLCHGVFDLIHPGHIRHFASAKKYADILVVSVTADLYVKKGPGRPIFREELRAEVLSAINSIDYVVVVPYESAVEVIRKIKPNYYVKGPDYKKRKEQEGIHRKLIDEEKAIIDVGGKLIFTQDDIIFSSSKLINDYLDIYPQKTKEFLTEFKSKYSSDRIIDELKQLRKLKILLIGDAIIDQYHYCLPMGKSSKEPVMVHHYVSEESFLGGVLACANHIASLCDHITLLTLLGKKKSFQSFIRQKLRSAVTPLLFFQNNMYTIVKRRYVEAFTKQKLFQVTYLHDNLLPGITEKRIYASLRRNISEFDMVVVNDYGHGLMTDKLIKLVCDKAKYLVLNVQSNSANFGFNVITKYPRADYVCIDEQEIRLATHDKHGDIYRLIKQIYKKLDCRTILVTKGPHGSIGYSKESKFVEIPSLTEKVVDRVGAGDAFFAITAPCVYANIPLDIVSFMGNVAAALKIAVMGNKKQIEYAEIVKFLTRLLK